MSRPVIWNQLNEMRLRALVEHGFSDAEIADGMALYLPGLTVCAVNHRRRKLKLFRKRGGARFPNRPHPHARRCLSCGFVFRSEGKHNRICKPCQKKIDRMCA